MSAGGGCIVVGVDEDPASADALRWAAEEAVLRDAPLEVVHAWQAVVPLEPAGMVTPPANLDLEAGAQALVDSVVEAARAATSTWPEHWSGQVAEGPAGPVLVARAERAGAALVVVGGKGRRALTEALLGSVSRHVTHHAPCPVVVVRGDSHGAPPGTSNP